VISLLFFSGSPSEYAHFGPFYTPKNNLLKLHWPKFPMFWTITYNDQEIWQTEARNFFKKNSN
jgi:hypothetical protein